MIYKIIIFLNNFCLQEAKDQYRIPKLKINNNDNNNNETRKTKT
jgi:hypothetical protein